MPGYTHADHATHDKPLGVDINPVDVLTVRVVNGEPVLHITSEISCTLTTLKDNGVI